MLKILNAAFIDKYSKVILAAFFVTSLLAGIVLMKIKPIDLEGGQTPSWWEVIQNVESGRGYKACVDNYVPNCELTNQDTAMREPIPVLIFALLGRLSNDSVIVFQWSQIFIFLGVLFGTFLLGRELEGISTGLIAAFMWTFDLAALRLETMITGDLLATLFIVFGFLKFVHVLRRGQWRDWLQFGALFALAMLSRSAALILVGALGVGYLIYIFLQNRASKPLPVNWFIKAVSATGVLLLIISVWVIRNYLVFGSPVVGTTLPGYVLYRHNAIVAENVPPHYVGPEEALGLVQQLAQKRPELVVSQLPETEINKIFMEEAVSTIKAHPWNYAKLYVYRFIPLWFNIGLREQYGEEVMIMDYIIIFQQAVLLFLIPLGLRKRDWSLRLIASSLLVSILIYLAVEGQLRYMVPITPAILVIAGIGLLSILPERVLRQLP